MPNIDFFVISIQVWTGNQTFYKKFCLLERRAVSSGCDPWSVFPLSWKLKGVYIELSCGIFYEYDDMNILLKNYFRFVRRPPTKRLRGRNFHRVRSSVLSLTGAMKNADDRNFCLADYDAIGFDLDNTLAKYKLVNLMNVRIPITWLLSFYLVREKHVIILLSVSYETLSMFFLLLPATTV